MKRLSPTLAAFSLAVSLMFTCGEALAQNNPLITLDENGNGTLLFPGGLPITTTGVLANDPGPGGLPAALTYNLLGPPGLVAGDVLLFDPGSILSDIIRFNPAGTGGNGYPASVVFYSGDSLGSLGDTGFPNALYTNTLSLLETPGGTIYTPTANQPGFVPGFSVPYDLISDSPRGVPEPSTIVGAGMAALAGVIVVLRRRKRTV